jgi:hypothetical protein
VHLYLTWPDDGGEPIRNRGNLPRHVDVRGLGGYVIAPPSFMERARNIAGCAAWPRSRSPRRRRPDRDAAQPGSPGRTARHEPRRGRPGRDRSSFLAAAPDRRRRSRRRGGAQICDQRARGRMRRARPHADRRRPVERPQQRHLPFGAETRVAGRRRRDQRDRGARGAPGCGAGDAAQRGHPGGTGDAGKRPGARHGEPARPQRDRGLCAGAGRALRAAPVGRGLAPGARCVPPPAFHAFRPAPRIGGR